MVEYFQDEKRNTVNILEVPAGLAGDYPNSHFRNRLQV